MKTAVLFLLMAVSASLVNGQETWTQPVVVTNNQGANQYPDFTIDTNGVVHLVWMYTNFDNYFSKIFYKRSSNSGFDWSSPATDISKNDDLYMSNPKIACNDTGSIMVAYDHNLYDLEVYYSKFGSGNWTDPQQISTTPGISHHNKCLVDSEGRYYVFWFGSAWNYYYRYLDPGAGDWSTTLFSPYADSAGCYSFVDFAIDKLNNIHWSGVHYYPNNLSFEKLTYYFYNKQDNTWSPPEFLTDHYIKIGYDIALDTSYSPHLDWRERDSEPPYNDYTYYMYHNGEGWTEQELVVMDPEEQQIAVDGLNRVHIVHREKTPDGGYQLVHYTRQDDVWLMGEIIDEAHSYLSHVKLLYHNDRLYVSYSRRDVSGEPIVVCFSHYDIVTGSGKEKADSRPRDCNIFPNPFTNHLNIEFVTTATDRLWVYVMDISGKMVKELNNSIMPAGNYRFAWDGSNINNQKMPQGTYLVRVVSGNYQFSRSVVLAY